MRKFTGIVFSFLLGVGFLKAQIPNSGFELWNTAGEKITNWETTNGLMQLGNPQTVFRSTDAHSGDYACEMQTKKINNKPAGAFVPDFTGSIFLGKQIGTKSYPGFPYTEKPTKLRFWYKYNDRNDDTAGVLVILTRWNSVANKRDTLMYAYQGITDSVGVYTQQDIVLGQLDTTQTPDSAIIFISAATIYATKEGSQFIIDDLEFVGGTVGINSQLKKDYFNFYPNPNNQPWIKIDVLPETTIKVILIYDVTGKIVQEILNTGGPQIEIQHQLKPGLYFVELVHEDGVQTKRLIVE
ncbi:MAG: T9SS type A sorting domain-containing protein [Bacteroidia bacterium]|nr:T9SS type A sorting domain-containing protein [Bacteroidia bacterium]MCF8425651.1 T9SS type A sorting domain-containing protein [Bacteroidia bacterium]MCF8446834.1 T9SS type A sorting domain-containing protein [Bacteroidia bacterium]